MLNKEDCGQTKRPCKQPPGPCEVRRQKEEERRKEREIHIPPRPKKAAEFQLAKKKHPNCHPQGPKKPKRPDEGSVDADLSIEYGNVEWWHGRGKKPVVYGGVGDKCSDVTIRSKQEVTKKGWRKKDTPQDQVRNKTTPFQIRRKR